MQSLIQHIGVRAGALLMRRRPHASIAHGYIGGVGGDGAAAAGTADEQIKLFNLLLQSVCQKLLAKIRELDRATGELNNLMKVCAVPTIFVDEKLMVRSFTRESRQIFRLAPEDIGHSLLDVTCGLDYHSLDNDFQRMAETGRCVSRYLEKRGSDVRYLMRLLPVLCRDKSFGGAVLVFTQVADRNWGTA